MGRTRRLKPSLKYGQNAQSLSCTMQPPHDYYSVKSQENLKVTFKKQPESLKCTIKLQETQAPEEYRFIDLGHLHSHVMEITTHVALCVHARCLAFQGKPPVRLLTEKKKMGVASVFEGQCLGCSEKFVFHTSSLLSCGSGEHYDINVRAVWGSMATGGGQSPLAELMATMNAPGLSTDCFSRIEGDISKWWESVLETEMLLAGKEEKIIAERKGIFHQGVPAIRVVCDGGWSKRSHRHTYSALGGVAIIVGAETGKILHVGVRNRYCIICTRAENAKTKPAEHECFRNWTGSSQAMEADVILEGFLAAETTHGLRYMEFVGDGDSSVFARIRDEVPVWGREVKKIECANHACKCLRASLEQMADENPDYKGAGKLSKNVRVRLTSAVRCAIRMRSKMIDKARASTLLAHDIRNALNHVFNEHSRCSDFCKGKEQGVPKSTGEGCVINDDCHQPDPVDDVLSDMNQFWTEGASLQCQEESRGRSSLNIQDVTQQLRRDVAVLLDRLACKSERLLGNTTTNLAESWMSVRAKFDGGKQYNRTFRGSWHSRCFGAALRMNVGPCWSPSVWRRVTGKRAGKKFWTLFQRRAKLRVQQKARGSTQAAKRLRWARKLALAAQNKTKTARASYGPEVIDDTPDVSSEELEKRCQQFYDSEVCLGAPKLREVEVRTREQSLCEEWRRERRKRLTASNFQKVANRNPKLKVTPLVKQLLYSKFKGTKATRVGLREEAATIREYISNKSKDGTIVTVSESGLVVDGDNPFLGCSPDGRVVTEFQSDGCVTDIQSVSGLLEVKNVLHGKRMNLIQAARDSKERSSFCLTVDSNQCLSLKRTHPYYLQCQGALHVTKAPWLDFVVRTTDPHDFFVERMYPDQTLWEAILPKLKAFYFKVLLPELACPRHQKVGGIREPGIWFQAQVEKEERSPA